MFNYSLYNNRIFLLLFMVVLTRTFVLYEHFMYVRERLKSRARSRRKRTFQLAYARGPADRRNVPLDREIMPYKRSSENVPI